MNPPTAPTSPTPTLRLSDRQWQAAHADAQRLRREAIVATQDAVLRAARRALDAALSLARPASVRGTGPAPRGPSGSARTPPQKSPCAA